MPRLLMYFPENDLALAAGSTAYTPPRTAILLHSAGEILPLWMADSGDRIVCEGVNANWFENTCRTFNIHNVDVYNHSQTNLEPAPWGWSQSSRDALENAGFCASLLPDSETLGKIRRLSHRRTAADFAVQLAAALPFPVAPAAEEVGTRAGLQARLNRGAPIIAKAPWSCSGRGLVRSRNMPVENFLAQAGGIIRRQGSVMVEPEFEKKLDFAMLFESEGRGSVLYKGISLFETNAHGAYTRNLLASQPVLWDKVAANAGHERLNALRAAAERILPAIIGDYKGPLGIDMLVTTDGLIDAAVEINLRYTMGFLALGFSRYIAPDSEGFLEVVPNPAASAPTDTVIRHNRLENGTFNLTPPNPHFAFRATIVPKSAIHI